MKADIGKLRDELVRDEGLRLQAYTDTEGIITIGIGHNLRVDPNYHDVPADELLEMRITEDEAYEMFGRDIALVYDAVARHIPWIDQLDDVRQRVILNMAFNLGIDGLLGFGRMLAAAKAGDYDEAGIQMVRSRWFKQVKDRAQRLRYMMVYGRTA